MASKSHPHLTMTSEPKGPAPNVSESHTSTPHSFSTENGTNVTMRADYTQTPTSLGLKTVATYSLSIVGMPQPKQAPTTSAVSFTSSQPDGGTDVRNVDLCNVARRYQSPSAIRYLHSLPNSTAHPKSPTPVATPSKEAAEKQRDDIAGLARKYQALSVRRYLADIQGENRY